MEPHLIYLKEKTLDVSCGDGAFSFIASGGKNRF